MRGDELERLVLHVGTLFEHDAQGRIVRNREPSGARAPRFYLGRSRLGNVWRMRDDLSKSAVTRLSRLAGKERPPDERFAPPERSEAFREVLRESAPIAFEWRGPAFAFPDAPVVRHDAVAGAAADGSRVAELTLADDALLREHFPSETAAELVGRAPAVAVVQGGSAVSLCFCARWLDGRAAEAGVETAAFARGRGYAPRAVAAWALAVRRAGAEPLYSTSWENAASRTVARRLGLVQYGEDVHFT